VQWDAQLIGDGTVGVVALQIRAMLEGDVRPRRGSGQHVQVPYGFLTGMPVEE
jgi:4-amino-4-deoxychorismate lyase